MMKAVDCARFTGYRPCEPGRLCEGCPDRRPVAHTSLLVNLDNLGNVIQTTAVLPALRRALPDTFLTWVTAPGAASVLRGNPLVDRVMPYDLETVSVLRAMEFDLVMNLDKTQRSAALAMEVSAGEKRGFGLSPRGAIEPLNPAADYAYRLGLDDEFKFRGNRKPGTQIAAEALGFEWRRDPYVLELSPEEKAFVKEYRESPELKGRLLVGVNTGASPAFPNKTLDAERTAELIARLSKALDNTPPAGGAAFALLGGPFETEKNAKIASLARAAAAGPVVETPTAEGVRPALPPGGGLLYVDACDIVVSGDTSGLHMGIALGKWVVGYFGVTCAVEIDVYDRGVVIASDLPCSPCWRPACADPRCITELDLDAVVRGVVEGARRLAG